MLMLSICVVSAKIYKSPSVPIWNPPFPRGGFLNFRVSSCLIATAQMQAWTGLGVIWSEGSAEFDSSAFFLCFCVYIHHHLVVLCGCYMLTMYCLFISLVNLCRRELRSSPELEARQGRSAPGGDQPALAAAQGAGTELSLSWKRPQNILWTNQYGQPLKQVRKP